MVQEKFDDETLVDVAERYYKAGCYDNNALKVLSKAGKTLSTIERNILLRYIDNFQVAMLSKSSLSMRQMRDGLLKK